jgi:hypothetical protein
MGAKGQPPQGCRECGYNNRYHPNKKTTEEFIKESQEKYGDVCDYSKVDLSNISTHDYVSIICSKHGEFTTTPHLHLNQCIYPCPECARASSTSQKEEEIFDFIRQEYDGDIERHNRKILDGLEIDIYLPKLNLGIEYHGLYYHTEKRVGKKYHFKKANLADAKNVYLLQIFEHEWGVKFKSLIKNILGVNTRIHGRNTTVVELTNDISGTTQKDKFLQENHLQGADKSSVKLGLFYKNEMVSCMTFGVPRFDKSYDWEMVRYCSKMGVNVIGGTNKLLKYFTENYEGRIISYVNRRWFTGNSYKQMGFEFTGVSDPGYFYYSPQSGGTILSRNKCQKHKLTEMSGYDPNKSEYEIMEENGYDRVWDAGNLRFVL